MRYEVIRKGHAVQVRNEQPRAKGNHTWERLSSEEAKKLVEERYGEGLLRYMYDQLQKGLAIELTWGWLRRAQDNSQEE